MNPQITIEVIRRQLGEYGVTLAPPSGADDTLIQFCIDKVDAFIRSETNQSRIPNDAYWVAIEMICGEFIQIKYALGQLMFNPGTGPGINPNATAVASIRDGDTTVTYATSTGSGGNATDPASRFKAWLDELLHKDYDWSYWRRLRW